MYMNAQGELICATCGKSRESEMYEYCYACLDRQTLVLTDNERLLVLSLLQREHVRLNERYRAAKHGNHRFVLKEKLNMLDRLMKTLRGE